MPIELKHVLAAEQNASEALAACNARGASLVSPAQVAELNARIEESRREIGARFGTPLFRALELLRLAVIFIRLICESGLRAVHLPLFIPTLFTGIVSLLFSLSLCALLKLPIPISVAIGLSAGILVGVSFFALIRFVSLESALQQRTAILQQRKRFRVANTLHREMLRQLDAVNRLIALRRSYEIKAAAAADIRCQFESIQNRLAYVNWRALRGIDFEQFLVQVFQLHGFAVQTTKVSGDQGIDLVASCLHIKLGIQAKGYVSSVGNDAVQQAHAGKTHYRCTHSVVITNSVFTKSARELAQSVECYLIDENSMPDLIEGRIFSSALLHSSQPRPAIEVTRQ